jgi:D-sedoheptulose 7-phosphate isomerase
VTGLRGAPHAPPTLEALIARRTDANERFFVREAERLARLCHAMAERFARGGRLIAFGVSPAARSDVRHVAVEFVHPVIVGKRALPAIGLTREAGPVARAVDLACHTADIAVGFGVDEGDEGAADVREAIHGARQRGCLTVAFGTAGAEWEFDPPSEDPFIRQELVETLYHILWELVHVFFEHRGLLEGREARPVHDAGAASFLYPFLGQHERDLDAVLADVRRSVVIKAQEVGGLRRAMMDGGGTEVVRAAAAVMRQAFDAGGTLFALGNGGSATDAMDLVADLRYPPRGWPARRALDLTEDAGILTALANDIGTDALFARQLIAYGRTGDIVVAFSTSGSSRNVVQALIEARQRGLTTIALVGYDGGRIGAERLADFVVITPSPYVPRIQEAHATAYHILRELVEREGDGPLAGD